MIDDSAYKLTQKIADEIEEFDLPKATNVKYEPTMTLEQICYINAEKKGINLKTLFFHLF